MGCIAPDKRIAEVLKLFNELASIHTTATKEIRSKVAVAVIVAVHAKNNIEALSNMYELMI